MLNAYSIRIIKTREKRGYICGKLLLVLPQICYIYIENISIALLIALRSMPIESISLIIIIFIKYYSPKGITFSLSLCTIQLFRKKSNGKTFRLP